MLHVSCFESLANELICHIFSYLKPEENFYSFFRCNRRLCQLVKLHVYYSRHALHSDIKRLSTLHSWFKHLNYENDGVTFYMAPVKGQQARNNLDPRVSDVTGIHWHFWREFNNIPLFDQRIIQVIEKYPIKLNPLFYPSKLNIQPNMLGFKEFIYRNYSFHAPALEPIFVNTSWNHNWTDEIKTSLKYIIESESRRMKRSIAEAADRIWKNLQDLDDINIIEIQYQQQTAGFGMIVQFHSISKHK